MPGLTSTQPVVVDAIIAKIRALKLTYSLDSNNAIPILTFDGPPPVNLPPVYVSVMGETTETTSSNTLDWAAIGARARYERYNIEGRIWAFFGGADDGSGQTFNPQKLARDIVGNVEAQIEEAFLADPGLNNQNNGNPLVIWALFSHTALIQTDNEEVAEMGRSASFDFTISIYNRLGGITS